MLNPNPFKKLGALALFGAVSIGCGADPSHPAPESDEDDAPLSSYDSVFAGAPDNRTLPTEGKADAVYPAKFTDLLAEQSPVRNQASRGVCSIFSTVGLMEHLYIKAGVATPDFSEQYLQWSAKVEVGSFPHTGGSSADANLRAISRFGIPEESAWPYESYPWTSANDPECKDDHDAENLPTKCYTNGEPPAAARMAQKFKLPAGRYVSTRDLKDRLFRKKTGVIVGLDFFYQAWNHRLSKLPVNAEAFRQGIVLAPNDEDVTESHKQRAGHSILIVGWDDTVEFPMVDKDGKPVLDADGMPRTEKGFWIFKNSWGTTRFGVTHPSGAGYGYLSMRYVDDYGSAYTSDVPTVTPPTPPPATGDRFEARPAAGIPDGNRTGITSDVTATGTGKSGRVTVTVDITHPYAGDLVLKLTHGGKTVTLQDQQGGADDDLKKTFTVTDFQDADRAGPWTLTVADVAAQDVGTLNLWSVQLGS